MKKLVKILTILFAISILSCSDQQPSKSLAIQADLGQDKLSGDEGKNSKNTVLEARVDILFVVDDSGSMGNHQSNLAANINNFVQSFTNRPYIDYHIGVITTSMNSSANCCGRLVGKTRFVDRSTPNVVSVLAKNLIVGTDGSALEETFEPTLVALTERIADGYNKDFLRDDAHLVVIFITDAEDQGALSPQDFYDGLVDIKKDPNRILSYGVIVPSSAPADCPRDDWSRPQRIETFLQSTINGSTGKNIFSLCDPNFGDKLSDLADDLVGYIANYIYLSRVPDLKKPMTVHFGTQIIPSGYPAGWSYTGSVNAISFGPKVQWTRQPIGTKVQVDYTALDDPIKK